MINRYDEYGIPQSTNTGRFAYTGQIRLPEIGVYYYKARMYSPTLGRFLQTDPVGYQGGLNLYAYVGDDPVNLVDSDGKFPTWIHNYIIDTAFPGLTEHQRDVLKFASAYADRRQFQDVPNAYRHAMRAPNETVAQARARTNNFMAVRNRIARQEQGGPVTDATRINDRSLVAMGIGGHAAMDSASPTHRDAAGNPIVWAGGRLELAIHVAGELSPGPGAIQAGVDALRADFGAAYGQEALRQAMTLPDCHRTPGRC